MPLKRITCVIFLTVLLAGTGVILRSLLDGMLDVSIRDGINQEWAAMKGYLRIENSRPIWLYDREDPDQTSLVSRLQRVYLLADRTRSRIKEESSSRTSVS